MPIVPTLAAAFLAALAGNTVGYALGYYGGRPLVLRYGRYFFITEDRLRKTELFFARYGPVIIVGARFLDVFRQLNGIVSGLTRMPFLRFQCFNVIGAILWVGSWGSLGYWLGHSIEELHPLLTRIKYAALTIALAGIAFLVIRKLIARRRSDL